MLEEAAKALGGSFKSDMLTPKTVREMTQMSRENKDVCTLSNGDISNDLDGPLTQFSRSRHCLV